MNKNIHIIGDVEASGPCPGLYDMISIGLVVVEPGLERSFYAEFAPLHQNFNSGAYTSIEVTREQHLAMPAAHIGMQSMFEWIASLDTQRLTFWSDNNGFDWQFLNWYFWWMVGADHDRAQNPTTRLKAREALGLKPDEAKNPFGHSSRRIGDLAAGLANNIKATTGWKKHRITKHTHRADDDAKGNAEALLYLIDKYDLDPIW